MPKTTVSCPRCKSPIIADIMQLFDTNKDPSAKQKLMSGVVNMVQCPSCGYQGPLSTHVVYHDPQKELLLTYFPPDLGIPVNEQERRIGPLIQKVFDGLPPEKRKGYLLRPQTMFTMQSLIEKILEADGITKEMIQAQQDRLKLLQQMMGKDAASRSELIQQNEGLIDQDFFAILSRILEAAMAQGDEKSGNSLAELQQLLLDESVFGRVVKNQISETEEAIKSLQEASKEGFTREKLLDLLINAPTETRLQTLVNYARSGMDYSFFQILSEKIEHSQADKKQVLADLREKLLAMTKEIDDRMESEILHTQRILEEIVSSPDLEKSTQEKLGEINDLFVELLKSEIEKAKQNSNQDRLQKLEGVFNILQKMSPPPEELVFVEELLGITNDEELQLKIESNPGKITPELLQILNNVIAQSETQGQSENLLNRLKEIYRRVLKQSMKNQMKT